MDAKRREVDRDQRGTGDAGPQSADSSAINRVDNILAPGKTRSTFPRTCVGRGGDVNRAMVSSHAPCDIHELEFGYHYRRSARERAQI